MEEQYYTIILRHDTSTKWMVNDPVLYLGEYGVEDDTHKVKRGDGESKWSELPYEDFGLQYIVTFENLHGDLKDNQILVDEFDKKIDKSVFDDVSSTVVTSIMVVDENLDEGGLADVTRTTKNILSGASTRDTLIIKSSDKTVQAFWSINDQGQKVLNLRSASAISDYEPERKYYKDQLCYNGNKLYRAYEDITAEPTFNPNQWVLLASLHSNDIKYDNLISGLDSENVKDALDELKRRDDRKVQKSTEERIVYGTDQFGQQTVIPIDDLRKVDTVNHKRADLAKNVQLDASDINYTDTDPSLGTIRTVLDSKVDKTFAGHGAKIVRNVTFNYNEITGHIELVEDKVSPEDGSSLVESTEIDVVSEQELAGEVQTLNDRIDQEVQTLNDTINTKESEIYNTINTKETAIYNTINTKETEIYGVINTKEDEIYHKILDEHNEINQRVDEEVATLNDRITSEVTTLNNTIDTKEAALQQEIDDTNTELNRVETESKERDTSLDTKINQAVNTLNNTILRHVDILNETIDTKEATMNTRVDNEVQTLNDRIDTEVQDLNDRIDDEVQTLNNTINTEKTAMDNKKIDKDIAETIVTGLEVATHDRQPTIKITNKNTTSKVANYDYLHFGTVGNIKTRMEDADHIIIDSTDIDEINTQQNARLTNAESRLTAHDGQIATLLEHDINHDRHLEAIDAQIVNHETRLDTDEANITQLQQDLETEATTRENSDNALSQRITTNAVNITTKADKIFAQDTNNHVVGKLESDTITGNTILNLKETMVSPQDNSSTVERLRIISSDNTVVATRDSETGVIDIRTNLDTDVNYFVTTDIISPTIADTTTLDMANLTPTDKVHVELQDIISDPEGTWGRVMSIDEDNNTCDVVTFKKHAQAVWGTIKGTLADQTDLQGRLSTLQDNIDDEATARQNADKTLQNNINDLADDVSALDTNKLDKVDTANIVYGTDSNGEQTTYDKDSFGKVDTVNGVQADNNKNVTLTANDIKMSTDVEDKSIYETYAELNGIIQNMIVDIQTQIMTYTQGGYYTTIGTYITEKYLRIIRDDGVMLMARVMNNFTADTSQATEYDSFMYDVEAGNLKLIGIPEQHGNDTPPTPEPNWQLYTAVSINSATSSDNQHPIVNVYQDLNNIYNVGFEIYNQSQTDELNADGLGTSWSILPNSLTAIIGENLSNDYTYFDNETAINDVLTNWNFALLPQWEIVNTFSLAGPIASDGHTPVIKVFEDINETTTDTHFEIDNNSTADKLQFVYTPVGVTETVEPSLTWVMETAEISPRNVDLTYIENNFTFTWVTSQDDPEETFNILNDVMGTTGDTYDGLGGTEEEIEAILDDVLGNNE